MESKFSLFDLFIMRRAGFPFEILKELRFDQTVQMLKILLQDQWQEDQKDNLSEIRKGFDDEYRDKETKLMQIALEEKFKEAVFLSNPSFAELYPDYFRKQNASRSRMRYKLRSVLMYLQRFCSKNDTHSFFGPIAWGEMDDAFEKNIKIVVLDPYLKRETFFTYWAAEKILDEILKEESIFPYLKPVWSPGFVKREDRYYLISVPTIYSKENLHVKTIYPNDLQKYILSRIDGNRTVEEIWNNIETNLSLEAFWETLKELEKEKIISLSPSIPVGTYQPLEFIMEWIDSVPLDLGKWKKILQQFIDLRNQFAKASYEQRPGLMDQMQKYFQQITNQNPQRGEGCHYADRYLIYEDCLYPLEEFKIGGTLAKDLEKLLKGVKVWFHFSVTLWREQYRFMQEWLAHIYPETNEISIDQYIQDLGKEKELKRKLTLLEKELYQKYSHIYQQLDDDPAIMDELIDWRDDFYTSVDVSIAASSVEQINKGDYLLVLAECHTNLLLLFNVVAGYWQHGEIFERFQKWVETDDVEIINPVKNHPDRCFTIGKHPLLDLECIGQSKQQKKIPLSDLVIRKIHGEFQLYSKSLNKMLLLHLVPPDELEKYYLLPFSFPFLYGQPLWMKDPCKKHYKRIQEGRLVFQREHWILNKDDFSNFKKDDSSLDRFVKMWRYKEKYGFPDQVFVKFQDEPKPIFIDFCNYFLVEILIGKISNSTGSMVISEMLPKEEQLWLKDQEGHYTSELRMMAFQRKRVQ